MNLYPRSVESREISIDPATLIDPYEAREGFASFSEGTTFLEPVAKIWADISGSYVSTADGQILSDKDVWHAFDRWLVPRISESGQLPNVPIASGYLSYEALHSIESVPTPALDPYKLPLYCFYLYRTVITHSAKSNAHLMHRIKFDCEALPFWRHDSESVIRAEPTFSPSNFKEIDDLAHLVVEECSNFTAERYIEAVSKIQELIREGEVYQVNLSQQIKLPFEGKPSEFYRALTSLSATSYGGFFAGSDTAGPYSLVSASPELFFSLKGRNVLCSPIKGTRPRSDEPIVDKAAIIELTKSEKDRAELAMIVDLIRNDLGKVSEVGSVRVEQHARVEKLSNVYHLVSDVSSILGSTNTLGDLIRALFPSGSVTGAPKIASMRFISALEKTSRGIYTGSLGYLTSHGDAQMNVAIRTGVIRGDSLIIQSGGGVVIDSDPKAEYMETIYKARPLIGAWALSGNTL